MLLENSADPTITNKAGETPWDLSHDPEVKTLLQNVLTGPNERNADDNGYGDGSDEDDAGGDNN